MLQVKQHITTLISAASRTTTHLTLQHTLVLQVVLQPLLNTLQHTIVLQVELQHITAHISAASRTTTHISVASRTTTHYNTH